MGDPKTPIPDEATGDTSANDDAQSAMLDMMQSALVVYGMERGVAAQAFEDVEPGLALQTRKLAEVLMAVAAYKRAPANWVRIARAAAQRLRPDVQERMKPWMEVLVAIFERANFSLPPAAPREAVDAVLIQLRASAYDLPAKLIAPPDGCHDNAAGELVALTSQDEHGNHFWKIATDPRRRTGGRSGWVSPHGAAARFAEAFGLAMPPSASAAKREWDTTNAAREPEDPSDTGETPA